MFKVSVIIPTYNRAAFLGDAIRSVLDQTYRGFELIVVDNGSTDNTRDIVQGFSDDRIRYLRIGVNNGVSPARNLGIISSTSDYVAFLDDDDEWLPDKLTLQIDVMQKSAPNVGGVYTGVYRIDRNSGAMIEQIRPTKKGHILNDLCITNCVGTASTVLLRRECFSKAGLFDENIRFGEEYDLWIRISKGYQFECIEGPLVKYYIHAYNATLNYQNIANWNYEAVIGGFEEQERKYGSWFASNRKAYSERYLILGVLYCYSGNMKKARQTFLKAIKLNPIEMRHYCNLGLSFLGEKNFKKLKVLTDGLPLRAKARFYALLAK